MRVVLEVPVLRSALWREPAATRCVWLTLLAHADQDGFVRGVVGWLLGEANVDAVECRAALDRLRGDEITGSPLLDERPGGWQLLSADAAGQRRRPDWARSA